MKIAQRALTLESDTELVVLTEARSTDLAIIIPLAEDDIAGQGEPLTFWEPTLSDLEPHIKDHELMLALKLRDTLDLQELIWDTV